MNSSSSVSLSAAAAAAAAAAAVGYWSVAATCWRGLADSAAQVGSTGSGSLLAALNPR